MMAEATDKEAFCAFHGLPITYKQFGARIQGTIEMKDCVGTIDIYICSECLEVLKSNVEGGLVGARRKQNKLVLVDAMSTIREDDNEGSDDEEFDQA